MAVKFAVEHTRANEYRMLPEAITINPVLNGRHDLPDVEWLVQDILAHGQISPVLIRNDGGTPVLAAGFSRWRAISEINSRKLAPVAMMVRCCYTQMSEAEAFLANIGENRFRNNTTEIDDARNIHLLMSKYALTEDQVVSVYFPGVKDPAEAKKSYKWVRDRAALIDLSDVAAKALLEGRLKGSAARKIAKLSQEQQRKVVESKGEGETITSADITGGGGKKSGNGGHAPKVSKLKSLANDLMGTIDDEDFAGDGEFITVGLSQLRALMEAIK